MDSKSELECQHPDFDFTGTDTDGGTIYECQGCGEEWNAGIEEPYSPIEAIGRMGAQKLSDEIRYRDA